MCWVSTTVSVEVAQLVTVFFIVSNGEFCALTGGFAVTRTVAHAEALPALLVAATELAEGRTSGDAIAALAAIPMSKTNRRVFHVPIMAFTPVRSVNSTIPRQCRL
jgi:hypothetical protein